MLNAAGLYVKDVTYSGRSVLHVPLQLGSAMGGAGLRVVIGHDGGTISARVADKDGNPVGDARIVVIPTEITSEAMLADDMITGPTNQLGMFTSHTLASGKYLVISCGETLDATPESIDKLWRSRNRFTEVELPPNGAAQVTLQPATLE